MRVWRICKGPFSALDGEGARVYGGRWNHIGVPVVYTSSHLSLAVLELLVHTDADLIPDDLVSLEIEISEQLALRQIDFPEEYLRSGDETALKQVGSQWAQEQTSAVLIVPSVIVPEEQNVLINPLRPDAAHIHVVKKKPFRLDPRLL